MATTVEIRIPLSLQAHFLTQLRFLLASLRQWADLGRSWRVVCTVSRDTDPQAIEPLPDWVREYPVEFRPVEEALWQRYHYLGTALQQAFYPAMSDIVILMDADVLVTGALQDVIEQTSRLDGLCACQAWGPPPQVDLYRLLDERGLRYTGEPFRYAGHAFAFEHPKHCPPYFNAGFIVVSASALSRLATRIVSDLDYVSECHNTYFALQIALCLALVGSGVPVQALHGKFNVSNGDADAIRCIHEGSDAQASMRHVQEALQDMRVLHYNQDSAAFRRKNDMLSLEAVRSFCRRTDLHSGNRRLQQALLSLLPLVEGDGVAGQERFS